VRDGGHALGQPVRVRILARDVSIALQRSTHTSIQNCLSAVVDEIADDQHPALSLIRLNVGESPVLARLTRRSAVGLGLLPRFAGLGADQGGGADRVVRCPMRR
jgi:molybdate transport system ATP-binding protein